MLSVKCSLPSLYCGAGCSLQVLDWDGGRHWYAGQVECDVCITVQYSTVQYSAVQYSRVQHLVVRWYTVTCVRSLLLDCGSKIGG